MKKTVFNSQTGESQLVDLTPEEIDALEAERNATPTTKELLAALNQAASEYQNAPLTVNGFTENGSDDQIAQAEEAFRFARELNKGGLMPEFITWDGTSGQPQQVTPLNLAKWILTAGFRKQYKFNARASVKAQIDSYETIEDVTGAFYGFIGGYPDLESYDLSFVSLDTAFTATPTFQSVTFENDGVQQVWSIDENGNVGPDV